MSTRIETGRRGGEKEKPVFSSVLGEEKRQNFAESPLKLLQGEEFESIIKRAIGVLGGDKLKNTKNPKGVPI